MGMEREWKPLPNKRKTFRFAPDALRQASIESGFAMRSACLRFDWAALAADRPAGAGQAAPRSPEAPVEDPARAAVPAADGAGSAAQEQPLWLNAADPCCLTTDAGGRYPTAAELAQTGATPPLPGSPEAAVPGEEKPAKAKKKSGGKKGKQGSKKAAPKDEKGSAAFTQEELMERQVPMTLPEPLPGEVGLAAGEAGGKPDAGAAAAEAGETAAGADWMSAALWPYPMPPSSRRTLSSMRRRRRWRRALSFPA
jgi:hypothetical protein